MGCRRDPSQRLREATLDHNPSTSPALPEDTVLKTLKDTEDMTYNISEDTRTLTICKNVVNDFFL